MLAESIFVFFEKYNDEARFKFLTNIEESLICLFILLLIVLILF